MAECACFQLPPMMNWLQRVDHGQHASESFLSMCGRREREHGGEAAAFIASETWICTGAGGEPGRQKSLFSAGRAKLTLSHPKQPHRAGLQQSSIALGASSGNKGSDEELALRSMLAMNSSLARLRLGRVKLRICDREARILQGGELSRGRQLLFFHHLLSTGVGVKMARAVERSDPLRLGSVPWR